MKKVIAAAAAFAMVAGVATVASAVDLKLNGELRVRAWHQDYDTASTDSFMDQRLRVGGKFGIAEGVSATFRVDVTEGTWGNGGSEFGSARMPGDGVQWDRAHMDLVKDGLSLRAGQQYVGFGLGQTVNAQDAGIKVSKGAFTGFFLIDDTNGDNADSYLYGANYAMEGPGSQHLCRCSDQI